MNIKLHKSLNNACNNIQTNWMKKWKKKQKKFYILKKAQTVFTTEHTLSKFIVSDT